jgi:predicted Zn-dependent protease
MRKLILILSFLLGAVSYAQPVSLEKFRSEHFLDETLNRGKDPQYNQFFQKMTSKLLEDYKPDYTDTDKSKIRYYILNTSSINAGYYQTADGYNCILLTKGVLAEFGHQEDMLAALISHELTHHRVKGFKNAKGMSARNGKSEEYTADILPLSMLKKAGYNPRAYLELMKKVSSQRTKDINDILKVLDVHGVDENRIIAVEAGLTEMYRSGKISDSNKFTKTKISFSSILEELDPMSILSKKMSFSTKEMVDFLEIHTASL